MSDRGDAAKSHRSDGGFRSPSRRLILGGIPVAATLASKPALAMTGECSVSNALSGNLSHPLPEGTNCGLTPESWIKLAGTEQRWTRTGFAPSTSFLSACGSPTVRIAMDLRRSIAARRAQGRPDRRLQGRQGFGDARRTQFRRTARRGDPQRRLLRADELSGNRRLVRALVAAVWSSQPSTQFLAQTALDATTGRVSNLNINS